MQTVVIFLRHVSDTAYPSSRSYMSEKNDNGLHVFKPAFNDILSENFKCFKGDMVKQGLCF
jgi:hypothetical protein